MANKYNQVGTIWVGKKMDNGDQMPHTLQFKEGFVPNPSAWYQFHSKVFKQLDVEQKIAKGWLNEEQATKARNAVNNMSDKVIAEIVEVIKSEA